MSKVLKIILILLVLCAVLPAIIFNAIKPVSMVGNSMIPSYKNGEYLLINKFAYKFSKPQRGDVVVFLAPPDDKDEFMKRVIGLPGEKIKIESGNVYIDDEKLKEPYLNNAPTVQGTFITNKEVLIPNGEYAIMGDNRPYSLDSRNFGFISLDKIIGKVWFCYANCD